MPSEAASRLSLGFAYLLDLEGYVWIDEIATWVEPQENGTYIIVTSDMMKTKLFHWLHDQGEGFTDGKLAGIFKMVPLLQKLARKRLNESCIAFTDGLLNCTTFKFRPFYPDYDGNKTYINKDCVRFGKYEYSAKREVSPNNPPSTSTTFWYRKSRMNELATSALPMTYAEALESSPDDCPNWLNFLDEIFVDEDGKTSEELVNVVSLMCGYILMPHLLSNKIFMLAGVTASNGKSTFLHIIKQILPEGSVIEKKFKEFASSSGPNWSKADLVAKKLVICNEESSRDVDSGLLKEFSDGMSEVEGRRLYQSPFQFRPTFTILTAFNSPPEFDKVDKGLLRRLVYIPCYAQFDGTKSVQEVVDPILAERNFILAWCIQNAKRLHEMKWKFPKESDIMERTKQEMLTEQNSVYEFVIGRYEPLPKTDETKGLTIMEIYEDYKSWCLDVGRVKPYAKRRFGQMATSDMLGKTKDSNGIRYRHCRRIYPPEPEQQDLHALFNEHMET